ncbi:potassium channel family protein [Tepidicella baoligensis]|uniref:potassium channel family protein n=1 Tax=Tepidicella baoligensis TaxID=2707016 RepID=UPI0015DA6131|nr:NAD-binding protein [Tepidicella baoligensis]
MNRHEEISTFFLVLRRVRKTLITLIVIYAVAVLGLTLAPGLPGEDGHPTRLSFFHAFYFISYTATTIGFGEIPNDFSEQQRLWVLVCIYLSVIGWALFIGSLLQLLQDTNLQNAIRVRRFALDVRKLHEPFYIVCGYGETGRLLCAALDRMGFRVVVLELRHDRLSDIELQSYSMDMPHLATDAGNPQVLRMAGLTQRHCKGLIALTNDDACNLAVAMTGRLLAPRLPVLARAEKPSTVDNMASFDTRHIINPFEKFSGYLALAMHAPAAYHLLIWLTGLSGTTVSRHRDPPRGHWVLLGYGTFGRSLAQRIAQAGLPVTVIDLNAAPQEPAADGVQWVQGDGTGAHALRRAGMEEAVGIIAATANDVNNLSAAVTARQLNPNAFVIVRQNHHANQPLFKSLRADITMVPREIIAQECLAILNTPMLAPFLQRLQSEGEPWCEQVLQRLTDRLGWQAPHVWSLRVCEAEAPALMLRLQAGEIVRVGDVLRDPGRREASLRCEVLQIDQRQGERLMMPAAEVVLAPGDELLFVGHRTARSALSLTVNNDHTLHYVLTGRELPGSWIWRWFRQA